jgi:putative PIN family toxin of toxin-antitoxin system
VLDTNVLVGAYLARSRTSPNLAILRLWREARQIELVVSAPIVEEYLELLHRLNVSDALIERFAQRLESRRTVSHVNLGPRMVVSRDPDDDVFLTTAKAGRAAFLVTNDRDLLDIAAKARQGLRFEIVTPRQFLERLADE